MGRLTASGIIQIIFFPFIFLLEVIRYLFGPDKRERELKQFYNKRRCIVTGGASGIGLSAVEQLVRYGAKVLAADVNQHALEALGKRFPSISCLEIDITAPDAPDRIIKLALNEMQGIDVLFNNAGICVMGGLTHLSDRQIHKLVEVNFLAPIRLTKYTLEVMKKQPTGGRIAFTSSIAGYAYIPSMSVYGGTKAAIRHFARGLARELKGMKGRPQILISSMFPNVTKTNLLPAEEWNRAPKLFLANPNQVASGLLNGVKRGDAEIWTSWIDWVIAKGDSIFPSFADRFHVYSKSLRDLYVKSETIGYAADQKKSQ